MFFFLFLISFSSLSLTEQSSRMSHHGVHPLAVGPTTIQQQANSRSVPGLRRGDVSRVCLRANLQLPRRRLRARIQRQTHQQVQRRDSRSLRLQSLGKEVFTINVYRAPLVVNYISFNSEPRVIMCISCFSLVAGL